MGESVWGERQHRDLPSDANRIAFVIGTNKFVDIPPRPRAILVRQNSLRPAHFIRNGQALEENYEAEEERIEDLVLKLIDDLPLSKAEKRLSRGKRLNAGVMNMADHIARNAGAQFVREIFVNSTSPSNIEVTGRALDYGPVTALDGYPKAIFVDSHPHGDPGSLFDEMLSEFVEDLRETLPEELQSHLPTQAELAKQIRVSYDDQVLKDFLWKAGVPPELTGALLKTKAGLEYAKVIKEIALAGNDKIIKIMATVPRHTGTYDLATVLTILNNDTIAGDPVALDRLLSRDLADSELRTKLIKNYFAAFENLANKTKKENISDEALVTYMSRAAETRNRKVPDLMRGIGSEAHYYEKIAESAVNPASYAVGHFIDELISESSTSFPGLPPYTVILGEAKSPGPASHVFRIFDAKANEFKVIMALPIISNKVIFEGRNRAVSSLRPDEIVLKTGHPLADNLTALKITTNEKLMLVEFADAPIEHASVKVSLTKRIKTKIFLSCRNFMSWFK